MVTELAWVDWCPYSVVEARLCNGDIISDPVFDLNLTGKDHPTTIVALRLPVTRPTADLGEDGELIADLEFLFPNTDGVFGDREVIYGEVARKAHDRLILYREALAGARKALIETQRAVFEVYGYSQAEIDEAMDGFVSANSALRAIDAVLSRSGL